MVSPNIKYDLLLVLYRRRDNLWKLTDFGTSAEATSKKIHTTRLARGTESYRAPELLQEHATFTNKVDIWALGCVIYELINLKSAFSDSWKIREYSLNPTAVLPISSQPYPFGLDFRYQAMYHYLLQRDPSDRPRASFAASAFRSLENPLRLSMRSRIY